MSAVSWITSTDRTSDSERPTDLAPRVSRRYWHYFYRATHACIARYSIHQADSSASVIVTGLQCSAEPADRIEFVFRHGEPVSSAYPNTVSEKIRLSPKTELLLCRSLSYFESADRSSRFFAAAARRSSRCQLHLNIANRLTDLKHRLHG